MHIYLIRRSMDGPEVDAAYAMVVVAPSPDAARRIAIGASSGGAEALAWMDAAAEQIGTAVPDAATTARIVLTDAA